MDKVKISVTIITLNEEEDFPDCLESVKNLFSKYADNNCELVVVDSGSTDKTVEIAERYGAKVYTRKFDNFANQKNYAVDKASGEWILSLDADEVLEPKLAEEIKKITTSGKNVAYSIPRKNIIFGKFIKHTRWQPELDRHIWLWKKGRGEWVGEVHEELIADGSVGKLKNFKIHYCYKNVSEFFDMMNRYSELEAENKYKDGVRFSYIKIFLDPVYNFIVRYIYRLGFLDGVRGFILSYLMAIYRLEFWVKIKGKENSNL